MKNSIRTLLLSSSLLSLTAIPSAEAQSTLPAYDLIMDGMSVGQMSFRTRVFDDGHAHCLYTGRWTGPSGALSRTRLCKLIEYHAGDNFDCEENQRTFFNTLVTLADCNCKGFDEFGQATDIPTLVAGESPDGHLYGIAMSASIGDVEGLDMSPHRSGLSNAMANQSLLRGQAMIRPTVKF